MARALVEGVGDTLEVEEVCTREVEEAPATVMVLHAPRHPIPLQILLAMDRLQ